MKALTNEQMNILAESISEMVIEGVQERIGKKPTKEYEEEFLNTVANMQTAVDQLEQLRGQLEAEEDEILRYEKRWACVIFKWAANISLESIKPGGEAYKNLEKYLKKKHGLAIDITSYDLDKLIKKELVLSQVRKNFDLKTIVDMVIDRLTVG